MTRGRFDVWAPNAERVRLSVADEVVGMTRDDDGWWRPTGPVPDGEVDYGYLLDDDEAVRPDPRSRRQPEGVHERSRTVDTDGVRLDGRRLDRAPARRRGRLRAARRDVHARGHARRGARPARPPGGDRGRPRRADAGQRLQRHHNWGYDGVGWFAVDETYGGPAAYQRFVDGCHAAGLGVIQDVVYNHLGPSGNYLPLFGPYLKEGASTWGDLVNLDGEHSAEVRRYVIDNALMWLRDFHVDGLRLDAVHALVDSSQVHLLEELAIEVAALSAYVGRPLTLIAESDLNDPLLVTPREAGGYGLDAQWSDDFHHAVHVALTRETEGYYADFEPLSALAKVCERGFFHDGTFSSFRERDHGVAIDTTAMPTWRLVVCHQNHDQVGNRARGDRTTEVLDVDQLACAALLTLAGPFTPMLFQGEEWAASTPFQFFTSHPEPELGLATAAGRIREFERMGWDPDAVPDPQEPETFTRSKLDWSESTQGRHAQLLAAYRSLAALRRTEPALTDPAFESVSCTADEERRVFMMRRRDLLVVVNFGEDAVELETPPATVLFATPAGPQDGTVIDTGTLPVPAHAGVLLALGRS